MEKRSRSRNTYFQFKQFRIAQDCCAMKVTTDASILGALAPVPPKGDVLDIGTGTGLLTLMIAQRSNCRIDAVEIDKESFLQAKENVEQSPWADRINVFHKDVRKFRPRRKYDFIICNPPFFSGQLASPDKRKNLARHQSELSFFDLAKSVSRLLTTNGTFFALSGTGNDGAIFLNACADHGLCLNQVTYVLDQPSSRKKRLIAELSISKNLRPDQFLFIKDKEGNYTKGFIQLLQPYYLHL